MLNPASSRKGWLAAGAGLGAVALAFTISTPLLHSQEVQEAPAGEARTTAWMDRLDPFADLGPMVVCWSPNGTLDDGYIADVNQRLVELGRTPEMYPVIFPDGQYVANVHRELQVAGLDQPIEALHYTWWEQTSGGPSERYQLGTRWSGNQGDPRALTWSFVPDGLVCDGAASTLFARMDSLFASQGGRATWIARFTTSFNRWSQVTGLTYTRRTSGANDWDDGAAWGSGGGASRGDVRIAATNIDGVNGILAYNYFPSNGDMMLDSSENWGSSTNQNRFLRNTVMHEHGHGIGMQHVCSSNQAFLMEPVLQTGFDGPQHDDMRGGKRHYGDPDESDNTTALANDLGTIAAGTTNSTYCNLPAPQVGTNPAITTNCSIDANGEMDYYKFTVASAGTCNITVTPIGYTYDDSPQNSNGSCASGNSRNTAQQANLAVELRGTDGTTIIASASAAALGIAETITGATLSNAGTYYIRVYETDTPSQSQMYSLSVSVAAGCVPPTITTHPTSLSECAGNPVEFSVVATGTSPSYQWQKNLVNIPGATNSTYSIADVTTDDEGSYRCVVTNGCGTVNSNAATLGVDTAVQFSSHPASQNANVGDTVQFSAAGAGSEPIAYTWLRNGIPLSNGGRFSGVDTTTLTITNVQSGDSATYSLQAFNVCGATFSNGAVLTVDSCAGASISTNPNSQTVDAGDTAQFSVVAAGTAPIAYQWRKNNVDLSDGGNIAGALTATLTISNAQDSDEGSYTCHVSNECGNATSGPATLTVNPAVCPGDVNGDNVVDLTDLATLLGNYGTGSGGTYSQGDLNGDGAIDLSDLSLLLSAFGTTC